MLIRLETPGFLIEQIKARYAATQQRYEAGKKPFSELGQGGCPLQRSSELAGAGLDPALFIHCCCALFEHVNRARQATGFIPGRGEGNLFCVIACRDGLDR